jgi:hypothetical protein
MNPPRTPFLGWPGWRLLGEATLLTIGLLLWGVITAIGPELLADAHQFRPFKKLDQDSLRDLFLVIPFVPAFALAYFSLPVLLLAAPFILRSRWELWGFVLALFVVMGIAGIGFLALPGKVAYPAEAAGFWEPLYQWYDENGLHYDLVPALPLVLSVVAISAYLRHCGVAVKIVLEVWLTIIALAMLLTHQHHVLDVVAALLLGGLADRLVYQPWLRYDQAEESGEPMPSSDPALPV